MRKILNKLLVFIGVALFSVAVAFLTACDPNRVHYKIAEQHAPVKAIELINYDNPDQKAFGSWVSDHSGDLKPLNMQNIQVTTTLDASRIDEFVLDLSEQAIMENYYDVDSPKDTCIRILYEDGYFDILSDGRRSGLKQTSRYIGRFTPDGEVDEFIGAFSNNRSFENLLQKYFGS